MEQALIAQSVERILGKNEVMGSNPIEGSYYIKYLGSTGNNGMENGIF